MDGIDTYIALPGLLHAIETCSLCYRMGVGTLGLELWGYGLVAHYSMESGRRPASGSRGSVLEL
jgi:hypothetical protein|nr:hypothetical protein Q903MT_gene6527 [Picea sitchensis]